MDKADGCPVCADSLNCIALRLPYAHCTQSRLICAHSGDEMNEENEPMMLPNGHVYGRRAINVLTHADYVTCPRTKELSGSFDFSYSSFNERVISLNKEKFHAKDVKRVYVM